MRWKYQGDHAIGACLARLFAERTRAFETDADAIVPIPMRRARLLRRGFDQAAVLARAVASTRALPVLAALRRLRGGASQTVLGRGAREANVRGAFRVRDAAAVEGRSILLVDDVLTSGATSDECATVLRRAGARRVELVELQVRKASLEDVFVGLTKRDGGVASPAAEPDSVAPKASAGAKGTKR